MSLGGGPFENSDAPARLYRLAQEADAARAARLTGHKSFFRRLFERLRPHREEAGSDPQSFPRTPSEGI